MKNIETYHRVINGSSSKLEHLSNETVDLVVTSPPYPMIQMWDDIFADQNQEISNALDHRNGSHAFELMHNELDKVWIEIKRVLKNGGFACINIGDATRTIDGNFRLYPNHSRVISAFTKLGFNTLPNILWRKQTNAPNKFMGSGMLPAGAYVTLEHEWVLIFRKGGKKEFIRTTDKQRRRKSSFFWEERNVWFSDVWDLKGVSQKLMSSETRKRSGAFPFEVPYRLINMYSIKGDLVLDPFLGTGTTSFAAVAAERNSVGYEIDPILANQSKGDLCSLPLDFYNAPQIRRYQRHLDFLVERKSQGKAIIKHYNDILDVPVMTSQEKDLNFSIVTRIINENMDKIKALYSENTFIENLNLQKHQIALDL